MKYFFAWCLCVIAISGCIKEDGCEAATPASEEETIKTFATNNAINTVKHSSGLYYEIVNRGYGAVPHLNSEITVSYVGRFLDGTIFDQNSQVKNQLRRFIEGWQIGLQLIHKGGSIRLIIPSAYAYGCTRYENIPPNSILYFEINLVDVQ